MGASKLKGRREPASRLTANVDKQRVAVSQTLDPQRRKILGQFMTPRSVAALLAQKFQSLPGHVKLLDAGAGMGALSSAFVEHACDRSDPPTSIDVTAYEVDPKLASVLSETLNACATACATAGITFSFRVIEDDYILRSAEPLLDVRGTYNCAILNPPYGKISTSSRWRTALRTLGIETVNLYSAFTAVALQQLEHGGELVAITPRSFCNGSYYEPFRRLVLGASALVSLHVFESRRTAFKDDDVLQENIVFHLRKGGEKTDVVLSSDMEEPRLVAYSDVVRPSDSHMFIRLPSSDVGSAARIQALPCSLSDLGIKVSTGRVVDFRAREHLRKLPDSESVPLIYPAHFKDGDIVWPIADFKKHNALACNDETQSLIVPPGVYVLTKRFSAKEEKRRLVAAIYDGGRAGFENHVNYFHQDGHGLPLRFARGLAAFLNSTAVDLYFRTLSGHTQVNATDLRNLHYPDRTQIEQLGIQAVETSIDEAVDRLLSLPL